MSTVKATNFQNASSATANMVTDASGNVSFGGTAAMSSSFLRNRIINGDMRIDQRNAGASVTPINAQYTIDRYQSQISQTAKISISQSSTAPAGFSKSLLVTSLSAYSVLAADFFAVGQAIEGFNISDFNYGTADSTTATLSFWVRSSLTGTFGGAINSGSGSFPFTYSIASANIWTNISVAISANTAYAPTSTTNGVGLYVWFGLGVGSTFSGTAGSWQSGFKESATGATSVVGTSGATFYVTGVQLEVGTVATPFERQLYNAQLAQCQRYYEHSYSQDTAAGTSTDVGTVSTKSPQTDMQDTIQFAVEKRAAPTITYYTNLGVSGSWRSITAAQNRVMANPTNPSTRQFTWSNSNSVTVGDVLRGHWTAAIEL